MSSEWNLNFRKFTAKFEVERIVLSKKDYVEISTHLDVYKYFYTKCVAILHSCVEI